MATKYESDFLTYVPKNQYPSETYAYTFDPINNRTTDTTWDDPAQATVERTFINNPLNQTTEIQKPATPTRNQAYDPDGNLTNLQTDTKDLILTYNAENRLIQTQPRLVDEGSQQVNFQYDYQGRRIQKQVLTFNGGAWQLSAHRQFVYDGWNLIEEIDLIPTEPVSKYYVWGLDLSESFQGAGGIGGLVAVIHTTGTDYAAFDGNGNLGQLVEAGSGQVVAHYEYDPFGNLLSSIGDRAVDNHIRFSTKYFDQEIDIYYYGYRYYAPELGRWLNRDPLREGGSLNLYGFVSNNPLVIIDALGLKDYMQIPRLSRYQHGINPLTNIAGGARNILVDLLFNPIIDGANVPIHDAQYIAEHGWKEYGAQLREANIQDLKNLAKLPSSLKQAVSTYLDGVIDYHLNTPIEDQLLAALYCALNAENWENAAKIMLALALMKG